VRGSGGYGVSQLAGYQTADGGIISVYQLDQVQALDAAERSSLVPQALPFEVIPSEKTQSGMMTMRRNLSADTSITARALLGERTFDQIYTSGPSLSTQSSGRVKLTTGDIQASHLLENGWSVETVGNWSRDEETSFTRVAALGQRTATRSTLTSLDAKVRDAFFEIPTGLLRMYGGVSWRSEWFNNLVSKLGTTGSGLRRDVLGAYTEAHIPLLGDPDNPVESDAVELSLAVRHDQYHHHEAGVANASTTNPTVGLLWEPQSGISVRASYARSFRMASLAQMDGSKDTALLLLLPDPRVPNSTTGTAYITGGNQNLHPELASSYTAGLDLVSSRHADTGLSLAYFQVKYADRIATPPVQGSVDTIFSQLDSLRPYITLDPTQSEVQGLYRQYNVLNAMQLGSGDLKAFFDSRLQNITSSYERGVELSAKSQFGTAWGTFTLAISGQYIITLESQAAPTASSVSLAGSVFNPPSKRCIGQAQWSHSGWTVGTRLNYTSAFSDPLSTNAPRVSPWMTFDAQVSYQPAWLTRTGEERVRFELNVVNVSNRPAPFAHSLVDQTGGYDPTNATPLGRSITAGVRYNL
jgi:outer membrane receptor protein involved in Fe transport